MMEEMLGKYTKKSKPGAIGNGGVIAGCIER